jgi:tRNA A-37 threonylcarbamoyl transferase component Bud32
MKSTLIETGNARILYDATAMAAPETTQFDPEFWKNRDAVVGRPGGRGGAVIIRCPAGEAVLKRYLRGGMMAKINQALYLFSGFEYSRAFREFRLLQNMHKMHLPVPEPLAAMCETTSAVFSRMALMTRLLPDTETLVEKHKLQAVSAANWEAIGQTLKRFHGKGIYHADLNANNVLINTTGRVFLIDFDKCHIKEPDSSWQNKNIQRLKRSLNKLFPGDLFPRVGWDVLIQAYEKDFQGK